MTELDLLFEGWTPQQWGTAAAAGLAALLMIFFAWKSRRAWLDLPELPRRPVSPDAARAAVVIPARNEEANIARAVSSFPRGQVVVVDDASTDRTAELAREHGAQVVPAPPLQRGLMGKPNACHAGAAAAPPADYLLFVDADTWYEPEFLSSFVAAASAENASVVSAFLHQECVTLAERMILPYAFALYFCGVDSAEVNDSAQPTALANGQCLMFKRSAYDFIGGHGSVLKSVIEDVELARVAKKHRLPLTVYRAEHLGSVRMYDGFPAIWRGFTKNAFRFLLVNPGAGFLVVLASVVMTSWLPLAVASFWQRNWVAGALMILLPPVLFKPWYGSWSRAWLVWPGIYAFQLIALNAMRVTTFGRKTQWKGRPV